MTNVEAVETAIKSEFDRRKFIKRAGASGLGVAAVTMLGGSLGKIQAATFTDADILNFALNLEYLEGEFYSVASYGATLERRGIIPSSAVGGPTYGGQRVPNFSASPVAFLASAIRYDEEQHVVFLRAALGSGAVKKPTINLGALGFGFANMNQFLQLSRAFEDVGVSAYAGAVPAIQNQTFRDAAVRIAETEAQHSGAIRTEVIINGVSSAAVDSVDVPPSPSHPFFVDSKALSIPRTPQQVLKIVYHGGTTSGGFFPNGFNGTIRSAA